MIPTGGFVNARLWALALVLLTPCCTNEPEVSRSVYPWAGQDAATPLPIDLDIPAQEYDPRDLTGVWTQGGYPSLSEQPPPMTARGRELFDSTVTARTNSEREGVPPAFGNDPIMHCDPSGFPRILIGTPRPKEFAHLPGRIVQFFERNRHWRDIWMDGRELPADPDPRWLGYSVGHWEGNTLVVETVGLDGRAWIDNYGYRYSNQARIVERWRRLDGETLELDITLHDPEVYTQPWVGDTKTFERLPQKEWPQGELREELCVPSEEAQFNQRVRDPAGGVTGQ